MHFGHPAPTRAAYIHIPFCLSKCHYCDFNSYPGMDSIYGEYVRALITEIERPHGSVEKLDTIYIGGGTPTVLSTGQLGDILSAISCSIGISDNAEVTVEANPGTIDELKLAQLHWLNFNRLSLGVQSFDDDYLAMLGRAHGSKQAVDAYYCARKAGFDNISIDLIFAMPGQRLTHWENTLDAAIGLEPEHISLYELSIEEGTLFCELCAKGEISPLGEDDQIAMYETAIAKMQEAGYEHYEVSNFARPGYRCRHNQFYWRNESYYGFGAGATSYVAGERAVRIKDPNEYIASIMSGGDAVASSEGLTGRAHFAETLILGLRMIDGIDMNKLSKQTYTDIGGEFAHEIESLRSRGFVDLSKGILKVTHKGLLLLNYVSAELITPPD
ncbi:radical SAM family heme chaperone HemW [bacterium]|nr:radical SAM family heme chaperone HemW [bacterium]